MRTTRSWFLILHLFFLVIATRAFPFAVVTPTKWATEAAVDVLKRGGNATDAMIAASFVLNVTQPYMMGIGGGGFFLAQKNGRTYLWDHREMAPASAHPKMFLKENGEPINYYPERVTGPNPVGVPGTPLGLWSAHKKLGSRPWKELLQPAIKLAREGFPVTWLFAEDLADNWERISSFPTTKATFGNGEGGPLPGGRILRQPLLARTLEIIAEKGAPEFYTGELAKSWTAAAQKQGVKITLDDLRAYKVKTRKPVSYHALGLRALTMTPPSASSIVAGGMLRYLDHYYKTHPVPDALSAERVIVSTEAMKHFQELRNKHIADPPHNTLDPVKFFGSAEEKQAWVEIDKRVEARLDRIRTAVTQQTPRRKTNLFAFHPSPEPDRGHTAHLSIADDHGMAVSYTSTIEEVFGSGIVVTGHGFLLNNELSDFYPEPGHPNSPATGKRPRSNMSPHLFFEGKSLVGVVGCAGGGYIPTIVASVMENYRLHKMSAREAMAAPRFHPNGDKLEVENTMPKSTIEKLKEAEYDVEVGPAYGRAQVLLRRSGKARWEAATEPRADGKDYVD